MNSNEKKYIQIQTGPVKSIPTRQSSISFFAIMTFISSRGLSEVQERELAIDIERSLGGLKWFALSSFVKDKDKSDVYGDTATPDGKSKRRKFENKINYLRSLSKIQKENAYCSHFLSIIPKQTPSFWPLPMLSFSFSCNPVWCVLV